MKEFFEDWKYELSKKWSSFTYSLYRRRWYRIRLFLRFLKYDYWGPWEMVNPMLEIPFEIFCELYENGIDWRYKGLIDIDTVSEYEKEFIEYQNSRYIEMERLYKWWTVEYKQRQEELDELLGVWGEHHVSWMGTPTDKRDADKGCLQWFTADTKYSRYLSDLLHKEEEKFEKEKEDNLISLMKLRNFLWS